MLSVFSMTKQHFPDIYWRCHLTHVSVILTGFIISYIWIYCHPHGWCNGDHIQRRYWRQSSQSAGLLSPTVSCHLSVITISVSPYDHIKIEEVIHDTWAMSCWDSERIACKRWIWCHKLHWILIHINHYNDVIMGSIASQITSLTTVYSIVYSDAGQGKHQSSASLAFVRGIHRGPVNPPHKWPVTRKIYIWIYCHPHGWCNGDHIQRRYWRQSSQSAGLLSPTVSCHLSVITISVSPYDHIKIEEVIHDTWAMSCWDSERIACKRWIWCHKLHWILIHINHYNDVIMGSIASQITSLTTVYSIVYSDAGQGKHQSSASLAFVRGIHRGPVNPPHKWPVTRKKFPFDDVIMNPCRAEFTSGRENKCCLISQHQDDTGSWTIFL